MSVKLQVGGGLPPDPQDQHTLMSLTYNGIMDVIKQKEKKSFDELSVAIKKILEEAFQEAAAIEILVDLKEAHITDLTQANDEHLRRVSQISTEHDSLKLKYGDLEAQTQKLQTDFNDLHGKNLAAERRYTDLQKQTDELKAKSQDLQLKYADLEQKYDTLDRENEELKSKAANLEDESTKLTDDYQQLTGENQQFKNESEDLTRKYSQLESQYAQLKDETQTWVSRYDALSTDYSNLQKIVDAALADQKTQLSPRQKKDQDDNLTESFASCSKLWDFVWQQLWKSLPLPIHLIFQYGKEYYERRYKG